MIFLAGPRLRLAGAREGVAIAPQVGRATSDFDPERRGVVTAVEGDEAELVRHLLTDRDPVPAAFDDPRLRLLDEGESAIAGLGAVVPLQPHAVPSPDLDAIDLQRRVLPAADREDRGADDLLLGARTGGGRVLHHQGEVVGVSLKEEEIADQIALARSRDDAERCGSHNGSFCVEHLRR